MQEIVLTIPIEHPEPTVGTVEWFVKNAARVQIRNRTPDHGREAVLYDHQGKALMRLACMQRAYNPLRSSQTATTLWLLSRQAPTYDCRWALTEACWELVEQLAQKVGQQMQEPEWMAAGVEMRLVGSDETAALRSAARESPVARNAYNDKLIEEGRLPRQERRMPPEIEEMVRAHEAAEEDYDIPF